MSRSRPPARARAAALLGVGTLLVGGGAAGLAPGGATASSHREAPAISGLPQYDNTDTYAFVSPDKSNTVTLVGSWIPFEEPAGGPNFYPWATDARYDINIDNDGDARPDITYRWVFANDRTPGPADSFTGNGTFLYNNGPVTSLDDANLLFRQTYDLTKITYDDSGAPTGTSTLLDDAIVVPSNVGQASMPDYGALFKAGITTGPGGIKSFTGQSDDPFFLDLRVFDLVYGGDLSEVGHDTLAGFNVNTLALQVPTSDLVTESDPVIGVWSTTDRRNGDGGYSQISRLGSPLVNEVVVPYRIKDAFNASDPTDDGAAAGLVTNPELPKIIEAIYGIPAPATPRDDLVAVFLTGVDGLNKPATVTASEQLRLNTSIEPTKRPKRLGVLAGDNAGFPNGRRLIDDIVDIALQVVEGELVGSPNDLGDAVNINDRKFAKHFPYVAKPHSGSKPRPGTVNHGFTALTGGSAPDTPAGTGIPATPVALIGVGLLVVLAGATAGRWTRRPQVATA
ncbi:MAG: DUF4331 domain-containing protein [Sporichthyaceae bacterium]